MVSLRPIAGEVEHGNGVLHELVYDKRATEDFKALLANVSQSAVRLDAAIGQAEGVLQEVREGHGTAHALVHDQRGAQAIVELGGAGEQKASEPTATPKARK
jgi:phospholipid/cholesterol/gamma-HCH transport system substrate-binding protein